MWGGSAKIYFVSQAVHHGASAGTAPEYGVPGTGFHDGGYYDGGYYDGYEWVWDKCIKVKLELV